MFLSRIGRVRWRGEVKWTHEDDSRGGYKCNAWSERLGFSGIGGAKQSTQILVGNCIGNKKCQYCL